MKICALQLGISPNSSLGGEIYDYQTLKGFTKKGIEVFIYLPKNRPYDTNLKHFHVDYAPIKHIIPPWLFSFISLPYLFKTYKREKFDILRIHSPRFLGLAGIIFHTFYPKVPILASAVTVDDSKLFSPIEKILFNISTVIMVQSNYMRNRLIKRFNISPRKIKVTYGGFLDLQYQGKKIPKEAKNLSKTDPTILFMGLLIKRKNPLFLMDLFSQVKKKIKNLKLIIVGSGPLKKEMRKRLKAKGIHNDALFIKSAYGQDKAYWLSRMDVFVFPSLDEGFGLSVTEAMSFSKPVVTSDKAVFKEIIKTGKNGYALPLSKMSLWAETITKLIKNPALSRAIGQQARKTVKNKFSWEKTYKMNADVVKGMIR